MQQKQPSEPIEITTPQQGRLLRLSGFLVLTALATSGPGFAQCNNSPIAKDDVINHTADPIIIHVLANDEDLDGDALTVTVTGEDCSGEVTTNFGTVLLTPNIVSSESCTIDYDIVDGRGGMDSGVVTVRTTGLLFKDGFETGDITRWSDEEEER